MKIYLRFLSLFFLMMLASGASLASVECQICTETKPVAEVVVCNQGHRYCDVCLVKFWEDGALKCPNCSEVYDASFVEALVKKVHLQHSTQLNNAYWKVQQVNDDWVVGRYAAKNPKYCVCPDCEAIYSKDSSPRQRFCQQPGCIQKREQGKAKFSGFCQECSVGFHFHADCPVEAKVRDWQSKIRRDPKTDRDIKNNCKACPNPRCHAFFYKDGGCNALVCGRDYDDHGQVVVACGTRFDYEDRINRDTRKPLALPITDAMLNQFREVFLGNLDELDMQMPLDTADNFFENQGSRLLCGECSEAISSLRFQCIHCESYSICRACMKKHLDSFLYQPSSFDQLRALLITSKEDKRPVHEPDHVFRKEYSARQRNHLERVPMQISLEGADIEAQPLEPAWRRGAAGQAAHARQREMNGMAHSRRGQLNGYEIQVYYGIAASLGCVGALVSGMAIADNLPVELIWIALGPIVGALFLYGSLGWIDVQDDNFIWLRSEIQPYFCNCIRGIHPPVESDEWREIRRQKKRVLMELARRALCVRYWPTCVREN